MTDEDLIKRLLLSRRTMEKYRRYPGRMWAGGAASELAIVETEIGILREYQTSFPNRADHIGKIIEGWMEAAAKIRAKMN